jgi:hypothetical protein
MIARFLAPALLLAALAPAQAGLLEDGWQRGRAVAAQAADLLLTPIEQARAWAVRRFQGAEHAMAASLNHFASTLRDDLDRFETLAGRAGFRLNTVLIKPGLIPEIELAFEPLEEISPESEAALRREVADLSGVMGALERAVILLLLDVDERVESVRPNGFRVGEVAVALLTIIPELSFSFVREGG